MGRFVDLNSPLSEEDKSYLKSRGRGYLIPANERRFGNDGTREPDEHELAGAPAQSPFYDTQERDKAVYDVGGAPLPGVVLDYDSGRVADRDNGIIVEPHLPGHRPGLHDLSERNRQQIEGFESYEVDEYGNPIDDHIDEDIVEKVTGYKNKAELAKALDKAKVEYDHSGTREDLENALAIHLQDERDAKAS